MLKIQNFEDVILNSGLFYLSVNKINCENCSAERVCFYFILI